MRRKDLLGLFFIALGFGCLVLSAFLLGIAAGFCALGVALAIVGMIILRAAPPANPGDSPSDTEAKS